MKSMTDLLSDREHEVRSADDIVHAANRDERALTPEEEAKVAEHLENVKRLDEQIDRLERTNELAEQLKAVGRRATPERKTTFRPTNGEAGEDRINITVRPRYARMRNFTGPNAEERAYASGKWLRAVIFNDEASKRWCLNQGMEFRAAIESNNLYGGALVPDAFSQTIIDLRDTYGAFRANAQIVPMSSDRMLIPNLATGISATFYGEGATITDTQAEWQTLGLTAKKLAVLTKVSSELAEDAVIDLADWLAGEFARAFAQKEDDCGFKGDQTSTYGGINGYTNYLNSTTYAGAYEATATVDLFSEVTSTDLTGLMSKCPEYARANAKWYCSSVAADLVFSRLAAAAGGNTIATLQGGTGMQYLGYPIVTTPSLPTSTASLDALVMMLFGDLRKGSLFGDRRGITVRVLPERYADTDHIGVIAVERFDIVNHSGQSTTVAGPVCALIGNAA